MRRLALTCVVLITAACAGDDTSATTTSRPATTTVATTTTSGTTTTTVPSGPVDATLLPPLPLQMIHGPDNVPVPESGYTLSLFTGSPLKAAIGAPNGFPEGCVGLGLFSADYTKIFFHGYLPITPNGCASMESNPDLTPIEDERVLLFTEHTLIVELGDVPTEPFIPGFQVEAPSGTERVYSSLRSDPIDPDDLPVLSAGSGVVMGGEPFTVGPGGWRPLQPAPPIGNGDCAPDDHTACLDQGRFEVTVEWSGTGGGTTAGTGGGPGTVVNAGNGDAYLWFFEADNWDVVVKVIDGCSLNNRYWVFAAALTDVSYTVTVTDTAATPPALFTAPGESGVVSDTEAFATCP